MTIVETLNREYALPATEAPASTRWERHLQPNVADAQRIRNPLR